MPPVSTRMPFAWDSVERQLLGDGLGALQRAFLALAEQLGGGDPQRHRLSGDHVLQRASLLTGEDRRVDLLLQLLPAQDQTGARAAQGLVGGGGDHVGVRHRIGVQPRRHQPSEMGHVDHQRRFDLIGDLAEAREVQLARVGRPAGEQQLGAVLARETRHLVHVHQPRLRVGLIGHHLVEFPRDVELHAVGQVPAVGQRQAHNLLAGLQQRVIDGGVGLRTGVRLHVGVLGSEQCLGAVNRQLLADVDLLAAAVVAAARVALGVLVGQHRTDGFQDSEGHEVLRGDHLQRVLLAPKLTLHRRGDLRIHLGERTIEIVGAEFGGVCGRADVGHWAFLEQATI